MGNRAVITTEKRGLGLYVHWNGGRDSVEPMLRYCRMKGYRVPESDCYGWARLSQVWGNFFGGTDSVGIMPYSDDERMDPGDNGIYVIRNWEIVDRVGLYDGFVEQDDYDMKEMLLKIDSCMPETERLGKKAILEELGIEDDGAPDGMLLKAAKAYLAQQGYAIDDGFEADCPFVQLVCKDVGNNEIAFICVTDDEDGVRFDRAAFERLMCRYLGHLDELDNSRCRFDVVQVMGIRSDRAMIRHHINAKCDEV